MREFPGYAEFCESRSGVRSYFPGRCENAAQGSMIIVVDTQCENVVTPPRGTPEGHPILKEKSFKNSMQRSFSFLSK